MFSCFLASYSAGDKKLSSSFVLVLVPGSASLSDGVPLAAVEIKYQLMLNFVRCILLTVYLM